jgi:hypothetical protein
MQINRAVYLASLSRVALEYLHLSPASRRRLRKENLELGGITEYKQRDVVLGRKAEDLIV